MSKAISDATVLINLAHIGRFDILHRVFSEVLVPPAVWFEVVEEGGELPGVNEAKRARSDGWLVLADPANNDIVKLLKRTLDAGEAEAIALAIEHEPSTLLLDESEARRAADTHELDKIGVVGLLILARKRGWISSLREELEALQQAGFWLDDAIVERVLSEEEKF